MPETDMTATALPPTQVQLKDLPAEVIQSLGQLGTQGNPYGLVNRSYAVGGYVYGLLGALLVCFGVGLAASDQLLIGVGMIVPGVWMAVANFKRLVIDLRSLVQPGLYASNTHLIQISAGVCTSFPFARIREFHEVQYHVRIPFVPKGPLTHRSSTLSIFHENGSCIRLEVTQAWLTEMCRRREVEHAKMLRGGSPSPWPSDLFGKWGAARMEGETAPARGASPEGSSLVRAFAWKDLGDGNRARLRSLFRKKGNLSLESPVGTQVFPILGGIGFLLVAPFASFWTSTPFTTGPAWISFALAAGLAWLCRKPLARLLPWRVKSGLAGDSTHLFLVHDGTVQVVKLDSIRVARHGAQDPFLDLGSTRIVLPFPLPKRDWERIGQFLASRTTSEQDVPPAPEGWAALPPADGSTRPDPPHSPAWLGMVTSLVAAALFHLSHDNLLHLEKWRHCKETRSRTDCVQSIGPDSPAWYLHAIDSVEWQRAQEFSTLESYDEYAKGLEHGEHQAEVPSRLRTVADSFLRREAGLESRSGLQAARTRFLKNATENGHLALPVHLEMDSAFWNRMRETVAEPWALYPRTVEAKVLAALRPRICKSLGFSEDLRMIVEQTDSQSALFLRAQWSGPYKDSIRVEGSLDSANAEGPMETWSLPWTEIARMPTNGNPFSMH